MDNADTNNANELLVTLTADIVAANSSGSHPLIWAKSKTAPMRWSIRRAVSGISSQMGDRTSTTAGLSTSFTGFDPISGNTWFSRLEIQLSTAEQKSAIRRRKTRPSCYMPGGVA
nr:hypothetical protein [Sphingobium cupriresistens]